ncbi:hypothetical protein [Intrasporangium sp.]|uniref:hypothetical protein n=1 Tax=Intrasporangium sp. TaxID=1925024 RepID=UPI00322191E2
MTHTIADVFDEYDLDLTEADFAHELARSLRQDPAPRMVSEQMLRDLQESGGLEHPEQLARWQERDDRGLRMAVHSTMLADLLDATVSASQAAQYLGISRSRLSHKRRSVPLLSSMVGRHRRYYRWQFAGGTVVPGLGIITERLTGEEHPLDVAALMATPAEELGGRIPVDYLVSGGNPVKVARILEELTF